MKKQTIQPEFVIEKGIPWLPRGKRGGLRPPKYPFQNMEVGDSFQFSIEKRTSVGIAASQHGRRRDKKFSIRGNRVWRVA